MFRGLILQPEHYKLFEKLSDSIHQLQAWVHSTDNESLQQLRSTEATLHTIHYFQSLLIRQPIATPTQTAAITT